MCEVVLLKYDVFSIGVVVLSFEYYCCLNCVCVLLLLFEWMCCVS